MIKKTFKELNSLNSLYGVLVQTQEGFKDTKLGYALKRFSEKNLVDIFTKFNDALQDMRIDNALADEKTGAILYQEGGKEFQYSKDGLKKVLKLSREITAEWEKKEFEVEPFICKDLKGVTLTDEDKEILAGLVI